MSDNEVDILAADITYTLVRLLKVLRSRSEMANLSLTERSTIKLLEHKELLPSELAMTEKITTQSMSQILNHLFELGYIKRRNSETDKRKVYISLSKEGQLMLDKMRTERDQWLRKALEGTCTEKERETLRKALIPLTKLIDFEA